MRQAALLAIMVVFLPLCFCGKASGADEEGVAEIYAVADVVVDVAAGNAASARDMAVAKAQRDAFGILLARLEANPAIAEKQDDNAISALVSSFEVQKENVSSVRYIGTFTVRFRPSAVRKLLGGSGVSYDESRSRAIVILPVLAGVEGRPVLWEYRTAWKEAWEAEAKRYGAVPVIVPPGDIDDASTINAVEAMAGNSAQLQFIIQRYQAGGALVAVLRADMENPGKKQDVVLDLMRSDASGSVTHLPRRQFAAVEGEKALLASIAEGARAARSELEGEWKKAAVMRRGPTVHIMATVPVETPSMWSALRERLAGVDGVSRVSVLTMRRGAASIELEFRGGIEQLQEAMTAAGLDMSRSSSSGGWVVRNTNF